LLEFVDMGLEVGYLPNAVRSPNPPVENHDGIFTFEIGGDTQIMATDRSDVVMRKRVAGT
jgi:hypothetical protein